MVAVVGCCVYEPMFFYDMLLAFVYEMVGTKLNGLIISLITH